MSSPSVVFNPFTQRFDFVGNGGGGSGIQTLTGNTGGAVGPATNLNILGAGGVTVTGNPGTDTLTITSVNGYSAAAITVSPLAGQGDYTTIGAALAAAVTGNNILIKEGTYTENLTLKAGVNLTALGASEEEPTVIIIGKCSFSAAGSVSINGVEIQTNGDYALSITGSAASLVYIKDCFINCTNNTGINMTSSAGTLRVYRTRGNLATTGISFYNCTNSGIIFVDTRWRNTGFSTTPNSVNGTGVVFYNTCLDSNGINSSGNNTVGLYWSTISAQNAAAFTTSSTGNNIIYSGNISSGTATCLVINSSSLLQVIDTIIGSSNVNAISGLGTLEYSGITFLGSSSTISTAINTQLPNGIPVNLLNGGTEWTTAGTIGQVLTSQGNSTPPQWATSTGAIGTINGDTGSITGATVTIDAGIATNVSGGSIQFENSGTLSQLKLTDANSNTFLGAQCGNNTLASSSCTAIGKRSQLATAGSVENDSLGHDSLAACIDGNGNLAIGALSLSNLLHGNNNIAIGLLAGGAYNNSETSNICISAQGTVGESGIIHIGTFGLPSGGFQTNCYIDTIWNNALSLTAPKMVVTDSTGLLGVQTIPTTSVVPYTGIDFSASPYAVLPTDYYISVDVTGGPVTVRIPNSPAVGTVFIIKDKMGLAATNNITVINVAGPVNIDGIRPRLITANYESLQIIFNGSDYEIY